MLSFIFMAYYLGLGWCWLPDSLALSTHYACCLGLYATPSIYFATFVIPVFTNDDGRKCACVDDNIILILYNIINERKK